MWRKKIILGTSLALSLLLPLFLCIYLFLSLFCVLSLSLSFSFSSPFFLFSSPYLPFSSTSLSLFFLSFLLWPFHLSLTHKNTRTLTCSSLLYITQVTAYRPVARPDTFQQKNMSSRDISIIFVFLMSV